MAGSEAKDRGFGSVVIMTAGILWGTMGIFVKRLTLAGFTPAEVSAMRYIFSAFIILAAVFLLDRKSLTIEKKDIWKFATVGLIGFLATSTFLYLGVSLSSIAVADVLMYTAPIWVQIASVILFNEKLNAVKILCITLTFSGCVLVSGIRSSSDLNTNVLGILFGLLSGICYASYSIAGKFILRKYSGTTLTAYATIFAGLGAPFTVNVKSIANKIAADYVSLLYVLVIAVFCTVVPYFLYSVGLKNTNASKAAVLSCIEPVTASLVSVIIAKEVLSPFQVTGIACVLSAIILLKLGFKKKGNNYVQNSCNRCS